MRSLLIKVAQHLYAHESKITLKLEHHLIPTSHPPHIIYTYGQNRCIFHRKMLYPSVGCLETSPTFMRVHERIASLKPKTKKLVALYCAYRRAHVHLYVCISTHTRNFLGAAAMSFVSKNVQIQKCACMHFHLRGAGQIIPHMQLSTVLCAQIYKFNRHLNKYQIRLTMIYNK